MMRSFYRGVCIAAVALISLGLLLSLVGFALGGRPGDLTDYYDEVIDLPLVGGGRIGPLRWGRSWGNPLYGKDTVDQTYDAASIRKLDFDLSFADVTIKEGDAFRVKAEKINAKRFITEVSGDTWTIECDLKHADRISGKNLPTITITVPKGFRAEELELESSAGVVDVRGLSAQSSTLKVEMGELVVKDFSSGDCDLEIGMGSLELSGTLTGRGSIDCGMGSAALVLTGNRQDFGYSASVGMGSITIGGEEIGPDGLPPIGESTIGGLGAERVHNPSAPNFFDIDCGMGSVEIRFVQ